MTFHYRGFDDTVIVIVLAVCPSRRGTGVVTGLKVPTPGLSTLPIRSQTYAAALILLTLCNLESLFLIFCAYDYAAVQPTES